MTYEYVCSACAHEWEAEQSISAKPLKKCPSCGKSTARRQISGGTGFLLKGGGWYADGYGSSGANGASDKPATEKAKTGKSDGGTASAEAGTKSNAAKTPDKPATGAAA